MLDVERALSTPILPGIPNVIIGFSFVPVLVAVGLAPKASAVDATDIYGVAPVAPVDPVGPIKLFTNVVVTFVVETAVTFAKKPF